MEIREVMGAKEMEQLEQKVVDSLDLTKQLATCCACNEKV